MHKFYITIGSESKYVVYYSLDFKNNSVIFSLHMNLPECNPPCPTWLDKVVVPIDDVDKVYHDYDIMNLIMYYLRHDNPKTKKAIWGKNYDPNTVHWTKQVEACFEEEN